VRNDERGLIAAGLLAESSVRAVIYAALGNRPLAANHFHEDYARPPFSPPDDARRRAFFRRALSLSRFARLEQGSRAFRRPTGDKFQTRE